jgi:hypothetical protein
MLLHVTEQTIFRLLPSGLSREGSEVDRMAERIKSAGKNGLSKSEFTKAFQGVRSDVREARLTTLCDAETIYKYWRSGTGGRRAAVLVHKDFAKQYAREHPEDESW